MAVGTKKPVIRFEIIFAMIWIPQIFLGLYFQSVHPIWLSAYTLTTTVALVLVITEIDRIQFTTIAWVAVAATIVIGMPTLFSRMPVLSYSLGFYLLAGCFALLAMRIQVAQLIFGSLVIYVLADTGFSLYQLFGLENSRPGGLFMDSNVRAVYLLATILFVFAQLLDSPFQRHTTTIWILIFLFLIGFHSTQSRALLALAVLALVFLWLYAGLFDEGLRKNVLSLTALFLLAYLVYTLLYVLAIDEGSSLRAIENQASSFNARQPVWASAWALILERPIAGHGFGLFKYLYPSIRTEWVTGGDFVHNDYLQLWLESGVLGLVLTLLPVGYFLKNVLLAYRYRNIKRLLFSGIGLCLMGFAFFNYFFWRYENLLVLAAVWKLVHNESLVLSSVARLKLGHIHRFIALLLFFLPAVYMAGKLDEARFSGFALELDHMRSWSDSIIGDESELLAYRSNRFFLEIIKGNSQAVDFDHLNYMIAQLDAEIARGTLFPSVYCARAEVGYLLNEPYETLIIYLESGEQIDPKNIFCQRARFNVGVAFGFDERALESTKAFLNQKHSLRHLNSLIALNNAALHHPDVHNFPDYFAFFVKNRDYLAKLGLELDNKGSL